MTPGGFFFLPFSTQSQHPSTAQQPTIFYPSVYPSVVGYQTTNVSSGKWYMVAVQFQDAGSAKTEIRLQDFIKGTFQGTKDNKTAPELEVWDPLAEGVGNYTFYHFYSFSTGSESSAYKNYWGENRTKSNWESFQDITIPVGASVWFKCLEDCTITVAGQVVEVKSKDIETVGNNKWNMIANPFPVALNINSNVNWVAAGLLGTKDNQTCPEIEVWDPDAGGVGNYTFYHFYSFSTGSESSAYKNYWGENRTKSNWEGFQKATIPVGCGFWFRYYSDNVDLEKCPSGNLTLNFTMD